MTDSFWRYEGYELHVHALGSGDPVVLLHGGMDSSTGLWNTFADLADSYRVIAFDRSGHGQSHSHLPDGGDYDYEAMSAQTATLLRDVGPAHLIGHSDGGNIALMLGIREPQLVRSIVTFGANYHYRGIDPAVIDPHEVPHNEMHAHTLRMWLTSPALTTGQLAQITCKALICVGESEPILPEHTRSLVNAIPSADLWHVPGATHDLPMERPVEVRQKVRHFLTQQG
jgi:pimeloyl-ACP methyl ester carboxylesterase